MDFKLYWSIIKVENVIDRFQLKEFWRFLSQSNFNSKIGNILICSETHKPISTLIVKLRENKPN